MSLEETSTHQPKETLSLSQLLRMSIKIVCKFIKFKTFRHLLVHDNVFPTPVTAASFLDVPKPLSASYPNSNIFKMQETQLIFYLQRHLCFFDTHKLNFVHGVQ